MGCLETVPRSTDFRKASCFRWKKHHFSLRIQNSKVSFKPSLIALAAGVSASSICGGSPVDFARDVRPLLNQHCAGCHGGVKQKGGLRLTNRTQALQGGKSGEPLVVAGEPHESELFKRITHADPDERMPPEEPLETGEIELLKEWIEDGAEWPVHWAYQPVDEVPAAPEVAADWPRNEIDRFVLARLQRHGIEPSPDAPPHILLRRLHLDLIGLPPALDEIDQFHRWWEEDPESALETTVDRLLASPHFGERWARHWLDQARYADSDGYEKDNARPHAWVWRDWVIDAINDDMPFDQFTIEQMAGDLLPEASADDRVATAFHRQTLRNREGGTDPEEDRVKRTIDRLSTTSRTWLGLSLQCAQCHDHPYDPVSQRDFYRVFAFFNRADEDNIQLPREPGHEGKKQEAYVMKRNDARKTYLFQRGDFLQPDVEGGEIVPGAPAFLPDLSPKDPDEPTRLDFAHWLVGEANPLTARVVANTIWMHLFGSGLSTTPDDFGSQGEPPSHPALLDWLAAQFRGNGWSRKELLKTIVLSRTYRQSSHHRPKLALVDPDNRLLHRQNGRRVEAEIVRDLHLAVSGLLDREVGGPSVFPPLAPDVAAQSYANNFKWKESTGGDRYRRGMYTFFKRTAPDPNLMTFDCPDSNTAVTQRNVSNTPIMALATLQNTVFHEAAQAFAARVLSASDAPTPTGKIEHAYQLALARSPSDPERRILLALLDDNREHYRVSPAAATTLAGSFVPQGESTAETAAWIATLRVITNLDEFVTAH